MAGNESNAKFERDLIGFRLVNARNLVISGFIPRFLLSFALLLMLLCFPG